VGPDDETGEPAADEGSLEEGVTNDKDGETEKENRKSIQIGKDRGRTTTAADDPVSGMARRKGRGF
jgi:hypothetical protein